MKRYIGLLLLVPGAASAGLTIISEPAIKLATPGQPATQPVIAQAVTPQAIQPAPAALVKPAAVPAKPVVPVVEVEQWEIKPGASLRSTLESWCDRASYRLIWNIEGGFRSQGGFTSEGDFKKAVTDLFAAVPQDLHLRVEITKNKLVVVTRGDK